MKKETRRHICVSLAMLAAFLLWTVAVRFVDVQPIGPEGSMVGFAAMNRFVHDLTGVHMILYTITDWLSLVPLLFVMSFGVLGLVQWIKRKHLSQVDFGILLLGGFYIIVMGFYILFETVVINYRPILIDGSLEASYPSSTTMLVMCVMPTALTQLRSRIQNDLLKGWICFAITAYIGFMVLGRLLSGVHWFSDIIGGALLSGGLVGMYRGILAKKRE